MISIAGKTALVTGASRGIGKEIAIALSKLECDLILHSRALEHTDALAEQLANNGVSVKTIAADLSDPSQVQSMLNALLSDYPSIDILYNNAAIMQANDGDVWTIPDEDFRLSFETNVISPIKICNTLIPPMMERGWGRVINLTTDMDQQPQFSPYAISKAALRKFVHDFVPVLEGSDVMMNSLHPGWLRTDMGSELADHAVETVIPGALVPALLSEFICGVEFLAQDYVNLNIEQAIDKAQQQFRS